MKCSLATALAVLVAAASAAPATLAPRQVTTVRVLFQGPAGQYELDVLDNDQPMPIVDTRPVSLITISSLAADTKCVFDGREGKQYSITGPGSVVVDPAQPLVGSARCVSECHRTGSCQ